MKKSEFRKMLQKLEYRGSMTLLDDDGNPTTRVDQNGNDCYSVYALWPCHCSCIACDVKASWLETVMVD